MPSLPFATSQTLSTTLRNNSASAVGFRFVNTCGEPIVVTHLGRWVISGNSQTHVLSIQSNATPSVQLAAVTVDCAGAPTAQYLYGELSSPYTIAVGATVYILSKEEIGGDQWYDNGGTNLTSTDVGAITSGSMAGTTVANGGDNTRSYGPVNFQYSSPLPNWTKSGNVYTTDGSRYSAQSAINDATAGDIIDIPAGTYTWGASSTFLSIYKAVTVRGAGTGSTTINIAANGPTYANGVFRLYEAGVLKDMTLTQVGGGTATAISTAGPNGWRVTNIIYNSAAGSGYFLYFGSFGLIDNCTVTGASGSDEWIFGRGPTDAWQSASNKGTANAVYIEDCTLTGQGYLDANSNASVVVRNCTITPTTGAIKLDGHGEVTNVPRRSFRLMECYRNTWTLSQGVSPCFEIRGGTGFFFDNSSVTGRIYLGDYNIVYGYLTSADYPLPDQIGVGQDPKVAASEPLYLWNNTQASANWPALNQIYGTAMTGVVEPNRDYFDTATSFNGTGGTGRGTRAQMDAITPTLTGVGFWVTDEGSWDTNEPANTSGRLYVWSGSAWVLDYTPYTYPHPLRGDDETDVTAPTPNPSTIASVTVNSSSQITVVADTAVDVVSPPVEYNHSIDGTYQGWQSSPTKVFSGLGSSTLYTFRVKARDAEGNETTPSSASTATTEDDFTPPAATGNPLAFRSNTMLAMGAF